LWSISAGLHVIHEHDLVHGHLHGGNVLVENEMGSIDPKITDTGLHGPVNKQMSSKQIYGVIPFVAPEIFGGNSPTKESDIYSFGMLQSGALIDCFGIAKDPTSCYMFVMRYYTNGNLNSYLEKTTMSFRKSFNFGRPLLDA
jgi:hypothetical protein